MKSTTTLGGTLIRTAKNQWQWADGTPEPRVEDLTASRVYNFRCRSNSHVEVLLSAAHKERDVLGWVLDGVQSGKYRQGQSGDHTGPLMIADEGVSRMRVEPGEDPLLGSEPIVHRRAIPRVALVPIPEWDQWAEENPYGASWDMSDQDVILAKARSLGWSE